MKKHENKKIAEVIEGNEAMAIFMGAEVLCRTVGDKRISGFFDCEYQKFGLDVEKADQLSHWRIKEITGAIGQQGLRFNQEWNWLMPLVEKVNSTVLTTGGVRVTMRQNATFIEKVGTDDWKTGPMVTGRGMKLNTFYAIADFLKWYNLNPKTHVHEDKT